MELRRTILTCESATAASEPAAKTNAARADNAETKCLVMLVRLGRCFLNLRDGIGVAGQASSRPSLSTHIKHQFRGEDSGIRLVTLSKCCDELCRTSLCGRTAGPYCAAGFGAGAAGCPWLCNRRSALCRLMFIRLGSLAILRSMGAMIASSSTPWLAC